MDGTKRLMTIFWIMFCGFLLAVMFWLFAVWISGLFSYLGSETGESILDSWILFHVHDSSRLGLGSGVLFGMRAVRAPLLMMLFCRDRLLSPVSLAGNITRRGSWLSRLFGLDEVRLCLAVNCRDRFLKLDRA